MAISAFAIFRLNDSLRRLPTRTATLRSLFIAFLSGRPFERAAGRVPRRLQALYHKIAAARCCPPGDGASRYGTRTRLARSVECPPAPAPACELEPPARTTASIELKKAHGPLSPWAALAPPGPPARHDWCRGGHRAGRGRLRDHPDEGARAHFSRRPRHGELVPGPA